MEIGMGLAVMGFCLMVGLAVLGRGISVGREAIGHGLGSIAHGIQQCGHDYRMGQRERKT